MLIDLITADFAEAQPELITSVHNSPAQVLSELEKIHAFVARTLKNELMWCASMPCELPPKSRIKLANFGETNLGRLKGLYRAGLAERYGKEMQTICAIHYNFSFSEFGRLVSQFRSSINEEEIDLSVEFDELQETCNKVELGVLLDDLTSELEKIDEITSTIRVLEKRLLRTDQRIAMVLTKMNELSQQIPLWLCYR